MPPVSRNSPPPPLSAHRAALGNDQVPYLARTLGLPRPLLQSAFDAATARGKYSHLCIYQDPPKGRSRIMLDCEIPIEISEAPRAVSRPFDVSEYLDSL